MRIFNQDKTKELYESDVDIDKGSLKRDKIFVRHHEAVEAVSEEGHYETIVTYPNGGKDVEWITDVPAVKAREAYDEYEDIYIFVPYTDGELAKKRIAVLKSYLAQTDYQAIKYAEGFTSDLDYQPIKEQRKEWREEINSLEEKL